MFVWNGKDRPRVLERSEIFVFVQWAHVVLDIEALGLSLPLTSHGKCCVQLPMIWNYEAIYVGI